MTENNYGELARRLREWNKWRRGDRKYAEAGASPPESVKELGVLLDEIAEVLENLAK